MAGDETVSGIVINEPRQQAFTLRVSPRPVFVMVGGKLGLDGVPFLAINQRRMLTRIPDTPVLDLTYIKRVRQDLVDVTAGKGQTPDRSAAGRLIGLCREIEAHQFGLDPSNVFEFQKQVRDRSDCHG
jgi:hypothetical protein